jgi:hypothetical protein
MPEQTELAWAAGFFDGEGTTCKTKDSYRTHSVAVRLSVPQKGTLCLERFKKALGGIGKIYERSCSVSLFAIARLEHVDQALTMLWPYLSEPKKTQAMKTGFVYGQIRKSVIGRPKGTKNPTKESE